MWLERQTKVYMDQKMIHYHINQSIRHYSYKIYNEIQHKKDIPLSLLLKMLPELQLLRYGCTIIVQGLVHFLEVVSTEVTHPVVAVL